MLCLHRQFTKPSSVRLKPQPFVLLLGFLWLLFVVPVNCHKKISIFSDISDVFRSSTNFLKPIILFVFDNDIQKTQAVKKSLNVKLEEKTIFEGTFSFLSYLGLDPEKLQDFAFDGMISTVNMIGQIFVKDESNNRSQKNFETFSPFRFLLNQRQVVSLLTRMRNPDIVNLFLEEVEEKFQGAECAKLLVCKMTPFVRGMQKSLKFFMMKKKIWSREETCLETKDNAVCQEEREENAAWENSDYEQKMYFFFPPLEEVISYGDHCDLLYPKCVY